MNSSHDKPLDEIWPIIRQRCSDEFYCTLEDWGFCQEMHIARIKGDKRLDHLNWEPALAAAYRASEAMQRELWEKYDIENHPEMILARSRN